MFQLEDADLYVMLNHFYSAYFVDYFEEVLSDEDEEYSAVTLFEGMNYFIELCTRLNIALPFHDIKEYIEENYEDGAALYQNVHRKYVQELEGNHHHKLTFQEKNGKPDFCEMMVVNK